MAREDREALRAQHPTWQAEDFAFVSSGATGGNAARFGNAPQRDPHDYYASADGRGPARDPGCRANCVVVEVHLRDPHSLSAWPLLALITTAEVAPGAWAGRGGVLQAAARVSLLASLILFSPFLLDPLQHQPDVGLMGGCRC